MPPSTPPKPEQPPRTELRVRAEGNVEFVLALKGTMEKPVYSVEIYQHANGQRGKIIETFAEYGSLEPAKFDLDIMSRGKRIEATVIAGIVARAYSQIRQGGQKPDFKESAMLVRQFLKNKGVVVPQNVVVKVLKALHPTRDPKYSRIEFSETKRKPKKPGRRGKR
jgi:hypothetical protein